MAKWDDEFSIALPMCNEMRVPPHKQDIEWARWILDAKVRGLTALCHVMINGKGGDEIKSCVNALAREITDLKVM